MDVARCVLLEVAKEAKAAHGKSKYGNIQRAEEEEGIMKHQMTCTEPNEKK